MKWAERALVEGGGADVEQMLYALSLVGELGGKDEPA
jgi:hypothetical protein